MSKSGNLDSLLYSISQISSQYNLFLWKNSILVFAEQYSGVVSSFCLIWFSMRSNSRILNYSTLVQHYVFVSWRIQSSVYRYVCCCCFSNLKWCPCLTWKHLIKRREDIFYHIRELQRLREHFIEFQDRLWSSYIRQTISPSHAASHSNHRIGTSS